MGADQLRAASLMRVAVVATPRAFRPLPARSGAPAVALRLQPPRKVSGGGGGWQNAGRGLGQVAPTPSCTAEGPGRHLLSSPRHFPRAPAFLAPTPHSNFASPPARCAPGLGGVDLGFWAPGQQRADSYVTHGVHGDRTILCVP